MLDSLSSVASRFARIAGAGATAPQSSALRLGSKGDDVTALQNKLNTLGEAIPVNGDFGPRTAEAVKRFQLKNNLQPANGIVSPPTQRALDQATPAPAKPSGWQPRTRDSFEAGP